MERKRGQFSLDRQEERGVVIKNEELALHQNVAEDMEGVTVSLVQEQVYSGDRKALPPGKVKIVVGFDPEVGGLDQFWSQVKEARAAGSAKESE